MIKNKRYLKMLEHKDFLNLYGACLKYAIPKARWDSNEGTDFNFRTFNSLNNEILETIKTGFIQANSENMLSDLQLYQFTREIMSYKNGLNRRRIKLRVRKSRINRTKRRFIQYIKHNFKNKRRPHKGITYFSSEVIRALSNGHLGRQT